MRRRSQQSGFSLIELMIAMLIGLFMTSAVIAIYITSATATRSSSLQAQLNEDGALALQILQQQLKLAGYTGFTGDKANFTGVAVLGCKDGFKSADKAYLGGTVPIECGGGGSDAIAIRFEADSINTVMSNAVAAEDAVPATPDTPAKDAVLPIDALPTNCANQGIPLYSTAASGTKFALADNRYYVAEDGEGLPGLYCWGIKVDPSNPGDAFFAINGAIELIPNVEAMRIQYVVTQKMQATYVPHQVTARLDADNTNLGTTLSNWRRVAGVNICIVVRSATTVPQGENGTDVSDYTDCDGVAQSPDDRYLHRAFRTSVQFRNLRPAIPATVPATATISTPWAQLKPAS